MFATHLRNLQFLKIHILTIVEDDHFYQTAKLHSVYHRTGAVSFAALCVAEITLHAGHLIRNFSILSEEGYWRKVKAPSVHLRVRSWCVEVIYSSERIDISMLQLPRR